MNEHADSGWPTSSFWTERVLITVKTYPVPHQIHHESVCTAGINDHGEWRRLWPIPFRFLEPHRQFHRYQWISARIRKQKSDPRKESHVVDPDTIERGALVPAQGTWQARRDLLQPHAVQSLEELKRRYEFDRTSMGLLRPVEYGPLELVRLRQGAWSSAQLAQTQQQQLLVAARPLRELPFRLKINYTCDDPACTGHRQNITDWEIGAFYFRQLAHLGDSGLAAEATHQHFARFFTCDYDTWLFVGTLGPVKPSYIVTGLFYPKKQQQTALF